MLKRHVVAVRIFAAICLVASLSVLLLLYKSNPSLKQATTLAVTEGNNSSITAIKSNLSTCSAKSDNRGSGQRVVSFSFYGSDGKERPYFAGIDGNADAVRRIYPGWTMRLYHEVKETDSLIWGRLHDLEIKYPHLDLCNISCLPALGNIEGSQQNTWRFLPMEDPFVDIFISRDLDARPIPREIAAVNEWLSSNITFHTMRDNPHHRDPMLGKVVQHDSYTCRKFFSYGHMRPWPTRRPNGFYNFVGFRDRLDKNPLTVECPWSCRHRSHRDWKTC